MKDLSKIKNRREYLTSLLSLEYLSRAEENHAEADRIHKGIIQLCKLWNLPMPKLTEKQPAEYIQSYEVECSLNLRRSKRPGLSIYDNRRSPYVTDRYYFGVYRVDE